MVDVLTAAIAREETQEKFFRRWGIGLEHEMARKTFFRIAGEIASFQNSLESRRESFWKP
jgi:hypothetical protein